MRWLCVCAASVHAGLASLIETEGSRLEGRRILLYSYGSGLAASLWSVVGRKVEGKFALGNIAAQVKHARAAFVLVTRSNEIPSRGHGRSIAPQALSAFALRSPFDCFRSLISSLFARVLCHRLVLYS